MTSVEPQPDVPGRRAPRGAILAAVLLGVLASLLLQCASVVESVSTKPKSCGNTTCLPDEVCCIVCPNQGYCGPKGSHKADCPAPLPFCPPDTGRPSETPTR